MTVIEDGFLSNENILELQRAVNALEAAGSGATTFSTATLTQGNGVIVVENSGGGLAANETDQYQAWRAPIGGPLGAPRMVAVQFECLATTAGQAGQDIVIEFSGDSNPIMYGYAEVDGDPVVPMYVDGANGIVRTLAGVSLGTTKTLQEGDRIGVGFVQIGSD